MKTKFRMNELSYPLIKRNDKVEFYGSGGKYSDKKFHLIDTTYGEIVYLFGNFNDTVSRNLYKTIISFSGRKH
jgi:hypothetical protein